MTNLEVVQEIVNENTRMKRLHPQFPTLPDVFYPGRKKDEKRGEPVVPKDIIAHVVMTKKQSIYEDEELVNTIDYETDKATHFGSVMSGYHSRVTNFMKKLQVSE